MFGFFSKNKKLPEKKLSLDAIKKQAKILFIDDEDVELISLLQAEGWYVEHWKDVTSLQVLENGKYDLIFLDIGGVGRVYSPEEEGFGILKRLKKINPSLLIVAYSGQSFDASKSEFWSLSDGNLPKSSGAIKAIELMEDLLKEKYTSLTLWGDMKNMLENKGFSVKDIERIESIIVESESSDLESRLGEILKRRIDGDSSFYALLSIAVKIIAILNYISGN